MKPYTGRKYCSNRWCNSYETCEKSAARLVADFSSDCSEYSISEVLNDVFGPPLFSKEELDTIHKLYKEIDERKP